jgi:hypothetical protein
MTKPRRLLERDIERQLRSGPKLHIPPIFVSESPVAAPLLDFIDLHGERRRERNEDQSSCGRT